MDNVILKKLYDELKKEVLDYEKRIEQGDIFIINEIKEMKKISTKAKIFLATYYSFNCDMKKAESDALKYLNFNQIQKYKRKFKTLNLLSLKEYNSPFELRLATIQNSHDGFVCEWCKQQCYILQKHHFPIPASKGGTATVNICPNCHYTFHALEGGSYE